MAQKVGDLQLLSPQMADHREMAAQGQTYIVGQGPAPSAAGHDVVQLHRASASCRSGRAIWRCVLAVVDASAPACREALRPGRPAAAEQARRRRSQAKRDRLFAELTSLEEQHRAPCDRPVTLRVRAARADRGAGTRLRGDGRGSGCVMRLPPSMDFTLAHLHRRLASLRPPPRARTRSRCHAERGRDRRAARPERRRQVHAPVDRRHAARAVVRTRPLRRRTPRAMPAARCARASACSGTTCTLPGADGRGEPGVLRARSTASPTSIARVDAALERAELAHRPRRSRRGVLARHAPAPGARAGAAARAAARAARRAVHRAGRRGDGGAAARGWRS